MKPDAMKRARQALGLTQQQMAKELGVDVMTVSRWERGVHAIPEPVARLVERLRDERRKRPKQR